MAMMKFEETKVNTMSKIKSAAKAEMTARLIKALEAEFGEGKAKMMRWGASKKSMKNEIGVCAGTVVFEGEEFPLILSVDCSVKEYRAHSGPKKDYSAFDLETAWNEYDEKVEADAQKAKDSAEKKAKKIEKDNARREKEKSLREQDDKPAGIQDF